MEELKASLLEGRQLREQLAKKEEELQQMSESSQQQVEELTVSLAAAETRASAAEAQVTALKGRPSPLLEECVICHDRRRCILFQPCGHLQTCAECPQDTLVRCTTCSTTIELRIVVRE